MAMMSHPGGKWRLASNEPVSRVVRLACVRVLFPRGTVGSDNGLQATAASGFSDFPSTATHSDSPSESQPRFLLNKSLLRQVIV